MPGFLLYFYLLLIQITTVSLLTSAFSGCKGFKRLKKFRKATDFKMLRLPPDPYIVLSNFPSWWLRPPLKVIYIEKTFWLVVLQL